MCATKWILSLLVVSFTTGAQPHAQNGNGTVERPNDTRLFNPATIDTIRGEVVSVEEMPPAKAMERGIHLRVKTKTETIPVHLGPPRFMASQSVQIREGDEIEVTGSRVTMDGKPAIIATSVKDKDNVLRLRDERGTPLWANGSKPQPQ